MSGLENKNHTSITNACKLIKGKILGISLGAYQRIIPGLFISNYEIICDRKNPDNQSFSQHVKVTSLEVSNETIEKRNSGSILESKTLRRNIKQEDTYILTTKTTERQEKIAKKIGVRLLHNTNKIRWEFENKKKFKEYLKQWKIKHIPGAFYLLTELEAVTFDEITNLYGKRIVVQIPQSGLGKGTFFVDSTIERENNLKTLRRNQTEGVTVNKYINGESASIICCNTKKGTLTTSIQKQIIDHSDLTAAEEGNGNFCGHDRTAAKYNKSIVDQTKKLGEEIGKKMYALGYKGIFGLDILIEEGTHEVYPIECNARFTAAFPMISFLDVKDNIIPIDIIHILEMSDTPYESNFTELNNNYNRKKEGSHIIIKNVKKHGIKLIKELKAGIYTTKNGKIEFLGPGYHYQEIDHKNQVIITNRIPILGDIIQGYAGVSRICSVLFPHSPHHIKEIVSYVYDHFDDINTVNSQAQNT